MIGKREEAFSYELPLRSVGLIIWIWNVISGRPIRTAGIKRIQNYVLSWLEIIGDELSCRVIADNRFRRIAPSYLS